MSRDMAGCGCLFAHADERVSVAPLGVVRQTKRRGAQRHVWGGRSCTTVNLMMLALSLYIHQVALPARIHELCWLTANLFYDLLSVLRADPEIPQNSRFVGGQATLY